MELDSVSTIKNDATASARQAQELPAVQVKAIAPQIIDPVTAAPVVDPAQLQDALRQINEHLTAEKAGVSFSVDESTGQTVVTVSDIHDNSVIRQIPSKEALEIARFLDTQRVSILQTKA